MCLIKWSSWEKIGIIGKKSYSYNNFPLKTIVIKCLAVVRGLDDDLSFFYVLVFEIASHHVALELAKVLLYSSK